MKSSKFLFYIGYSKSGTTFFKNQVLKKSSNHKYLNFKDYFVEDIFFDKLKLEEYFKSEKFKSFKKIVNESKKTIVVHKNLINPIRIFRNTGSYDIKPFILNLTVFDKRIENKMSVLISTRKQEDLIISYYNEFFDFFYLKNDIKNFKDFYKFLLEKKVINFFSYQKLFSTLKKNKINYINLDYDKFFKNREIKNILKTCNINKNLKINFQKKYKSGINGIYYVSSKNKFYKIIYSILLKLKYIKFFRLFPYIIKKKNDKSFFQIKKKIINHFKLNR